MIKGVDNRPYIEVTDHEARKTSLALEALKYSTLGTVGLYGLKWSAMSIKVEMDPRKLSYLHEGLSTPENPWWKVAGLQETSGGKVRVRAKDIFLEGVKRTEELMGGIPRTFGAFGYLSRDVFTNNKSRLVLKPEDLDGAWSHYEALVKNEGRELTALDRARGLIVQPHQGSPALFRIGDGGVPESTPLVENVKISARRWAPAGVDDSYRQIIRDVDMISEAMGAKPIVHSNQFPFVVTKASGNIKIKGTAREVLESFGNVDKLESAINARLTPRVHQAARDVSVFSKRISERYMRILDQPLEFIEELIYGGPNDKGGLLRKAAESKPYSFFKNIFGTGGNYKGTTLDLWARHAKRLGVATVGIAAAYEAGSFVTKALFDRNLAQVGGEAVGAGERLYAATSDLVGLTKLNKAQEEEASGSGRLWGVLAFPLSGYITGHTVAGLTTRSVTEKGQFAWRVAREETHQVPELLRKLEKVPVVGKYFGGLKTRGGVFGAIGAAIGGALSLPFLLGSLGSSRSYDEVVAEQRGETEVAVRKGASWEMGKTDIAGEHIQYYRPGWFRRLMDDPKGDLQFDEYNDRPFTRLIKGITDPYWREKKFYYERPYPVTGPDTTGMGPLGTLWGMTIGRIFKQPAIMHADELSAGGAAGVRKGDVIQFGRESSDAPDASLGGLGPAKVASPYDQGFLAGEAIYKTTEAIGLPGFVMTAIKKKLTGEQDFGADQPVMSSFAEMGSLRDNFWDLNIGGGMGTTEGLRRVIPNERFQLQKVNPIKNLMPEWMPGPEYFQDFQHGDPYAAIPEGEYRLPGSGYASRFQELEGVNPEDYPLIHRYKILADVAPYSKQFKEVSEAMEDAVEGGELSDRDMMIYRGTEAQLQERAQKIPFAKDEGLIGSYWSALKSIGRLNPVEKLLPFSPVHKFAGRMDPISEYEDKILYSKASPSWGEPIEDFIMPALFSVGRAAGWDGIPGAEQEKRDITGYFDKVEYLKFKKLEKEARAQGDGKAAYAFARKADFTMYGADPYGDISQVERILPGEDRTYFRDFLASESAEERGRILEMVPEYTRKFYIAQWQKQNYAALAAKGDLSEEEAMMVKQIEASRALEGERVDQDTWEDYQRGVESGRVRENTFPDYIRAKRLGGYFEEESPLDVPPTDWLGYDPAVEMDDVKLRVVQELGKDFHDFDLWESDVAAAAGKPYADVAADQLLDQNQMDREELLRSLTAANIRDLDIEIVATGGDKTRVSFDIGQDRTGELRAELEKRGIRYGV